jgi:hypothetical protein
MMSVSTEHPDLVAGGLITSDLRDGNLLVGVLA